MKNSFGTSVITTIFGESHGDHIGAVLDGIAPGIPVSAEVIEKYLSLRRPYGNISTKRVEKDEFIIASGVMNGKTTGAPIMVMIPNEDLRARDYSENFGLARPSHADYAAHEKYHGFEDYRGGGHFSGRITAALVAVGAIALSALEAKGIRIGTHIKELAGVCDRGFGDVQGDIDVLSSRAFPVLSEEAGEKMRNEIEKLAEQGDSVGALLESVVTGVPAGVGEPFFDSVESVLGHAVFSIPAVKGIMFGAGWDFLSMRGSEANDGMRIDMGGVRFLSNNSGGACGGITTGADITFKTVIKPTPSIYTEQETIDIYKRENKTLQIAGRHDPCIAHRARIAVDAVTALALCDLLALRYGTDYLAPDGCAEK